MAKYLTGGGSTFIDSPEKMEKLLRTKAKGFVTGLAQAAARELKSNVKEFVYGGYNPETYVRVMSGGYGNLSDAIVGPGINDGEPTENTGTGFRAYAGFNTEKMGEISARTVDNWGHHVNNKDEDAKSAVIEGFESEGIYLPRRDKTQGRQVRYPVHMLSITEREIEIALRSVKSRAYDTDDILNELETKIGIDISVER